MTFGLFRACHHALAKITQRIMGKDVAKRRSPVSTTALLRGSPLCPQSHWRVLSGGHVHKLLQFANNTRVQNCQRDSRNNLCFELH